MPWGVVEGGILTPEERAEIAAELKKVEEGNDALIRLRQKLNRLEAEDSASRWVQEIKRVLINLEREK